MLTPRKTVRYGWRRDLPDRRDKPYACRLAGPVALPIALSLADKFPAAYDQLQTSSCVGNATAAGIQYEYRKQGLTDVTPSRLMAYFNGRLLEGTTDQDCGSQIRDVVKGTVTCGVCAESEWPFDINNVCVPPPARCYDDAASLRAVSYESVDQDEIAIKTALFEGYPVIFGFVVYPAFESPEVAHTGIVPMPGINEAPVGGHGVLIIGYDDATRRFLVRNSWGTVWGLNGNFYIPYEYVLDPDLASDFWIIKLIGPGADPVPEVADLSTTP